MARHRPPESRAGRRSHRVDQRSHQAGAGERPGPTRRSGAPIGPARAISPVPSPPSGGPSRSTPKPVTRTCSLACCSPGKAFTRKPKRSAAAPWSSRISTSPATPGCRSSAPTPAWATSSTCRAATRKRFARTARPGVCRLERSRAQGTHQHRDHDEDRCGVSPHGEGRGSDALLRPRAQGIRRPRRQGR